MEVMGLSLSSELVETNPQCHHSCDVNAMYCYLNLSTDMAEDIPLDVENIQG
jgi:hypothetical protein